MSDQYNGLLRGHEVRTLDGRVGLIVDGYCGKVTVAINGEIGNNIQFWPGSLERVKMPEEIRAIRAGVFMELIAAAGDRVVLLNRDDLVADAQELPDWLIEQHEKEPQS